MADLDKAAGKESLSKKLQILDKFGEKVVEKSKFDANKHAHESRLKITTLFLVAYFLLIAGSFIFSMIYNFHAAHINEELLKTNPNAHFLDYLDVYNTVSIITTTLSSGVGFVIGYYFKNKGEGD